MENVRDIHASFSCLGRLIQAIFRSLDCKMVIPTLMSNRFYILEYFLFYIFNHVLLALFFIMLIIIVIIIRIILKIFLTNS